MSGKHTILKKIHTALSVNPILPRPVRYETDEQLWSDQPQQDLRLLFAEQFTTVGGKFVYIEHSEQLLADLHAILRAMGEKITIYCPYEPIREGLANEDAHYQWTEIASDADVAITNCMQLIARTGSIVIDEENGTMESISCPIHIVLAGEHQISFDIKNVLHPPAARKSRTISILTGPSRTADIEKTLVIGVHGSKELYLFLIKNPEAQ